MTLTQEGQRRPSEITQHIHYILSEILEASSARFQKDLVSVVLFGSHARGNPSQRSDIDLVIVVESAPPDWRERGALELSIEQLGLNLGKAIQIILVEPEDVRYSVENIAPLMLEIHDAHICLFDREGFFQGEMARFSRNVEKRGVRKLGAHKWEVPVYVPS
ncbi:MAG: nucleotidyltransferase domain-containing protein [Dehalococcoidia bacterium]